jgi:serine/threonine protein phosphatase PrpC/ribosomal protein L32
MSDVTTSTLEACPACGQAIASGDVFCESCGAELDPAAAVEAPPEDVDLDDTQPVELEPEEPPPGATVCPSCGGTKFEDGFCATCGAKQLSWRDHFTEAPTELVAGVCDKGVGRNRNEDAMAMAVVGERVVLVVCDGVTTAPDSDRASLAAARAARDVLAAAAPAPTGTAAGVGHWSEQLVSACAAANQEAVGVARTLGDPPEPPSCTFVAAVVEPSLATVAWCGDSRAYWLPDDGEARQLTIDHSLGTELMRLGRTRDEAEAEPMSHTITRWLGADSANATPETASIELAGAGWMLLCSDGLWNHLSTADELRTFIQESGLTEPLAVAEALVDHANAGGGHDNITAVLARIGAAANERTI